MKKIFALTSLLVVAVIASAQGISQKTMNNEDYVVVNMNSETFGYDNIQALFNTKDAKKLSMKIAKFSAIAQKMAAKAKKEGKKNFKKAIPGTVKDTNLSFSYDGGKNISEGYYMVPSLEVDAEGNSYLILRGFYQGYNITSSGISLAANDKVRYQQKCEYNYNMRIPVSSVNQWCNDLCCAVNAFSTEYLACR